MRTDAWSRKEKRGPANGGLTTLPNVASSCGAGSGKRSQEERHRRGNHQEETDNEERRVEIAYAHKPKQRQRECCNGESRCPNDHLRPMSRMRRGIKSQKAERKQ